MCRLLVCPQLGSLDAVAHRFCKLGFSNEQAAQLVGALQAHAEWQHNGEARHLQARLAALHRRSWFTLRQQRGIYETFSGVLDGSTVG